MVVLQFGSSSKKENLMKPFVKRTFILFLTFVFLLSACRANISRNGDGSLTVETSITQQELQDVITSSIADPLVKNATVSLQSGYVLVKADRQRLNDATKTDMLSFRLDLGVNNGQLTSTISNAQLDGKNIERARVDNWNQTIANRLARIGQKNPNATLQSVSVTTAGVSMTWLVKK
jgi:hypothetical protein